MTLQKGHGKKHLYTFVTAAYHKIQDNLERIPAQRIVKFSLRLKAHLHNRKVGHGPVKKGLPMSHFYLCKLCVSCFLRSVMLYPWTG